ncbi:MAG TPA: hypothetical protein VMA77_12910 [Solirubrobacteraceae bacterium]|nr:hypothetical protein [Solirubrobacteraceae bacterium]
MVPGVTLTVGSASAGVVGAVSVGSVIATGGGVVSGGGGGAVFVTTGAAARAWASALIVPELGYE